MKLTRKQLYTALIVVTGIFFVGILFFSNKEDAKAAVPGYKMPRGTYALSAEWLNTKAAIDGLLAQLEANPDNYKVMLQLVQAYIQESRNTGDHAYYDKAALELTDRILKQEPNNFETLCCKAVVLLSQHHFSDALEVAQKAQTVNPDNAFVYGLICDAQLESGNYTEAVNMADKMVSVRPDIRSYARVSYLREIYGDFPGAIAAMKLAVAAGYPGLEQTAWTRTMLGHLYECTGQLDSAEMHYKIATQERIDYPFALAGLGHLAKTRGDYKQAIAFYEKANSMTIEYSFADELTDIYLLTNQPTKARQTATGVLALLGPGSGDESDAGHGHYADKELAYVYLKIGDLNNAKKHAQLEYARRPKNNEVCEMMGWVEYKSGNFAAADKQFTAALKTGSRQPVLLCRAGLAAIRNNRVAAGKAMIDQALSINPFLDVQLKNEALRYVPAS